jgi:hypothetical protein
VSRTVQNHTSLKLTKPHAIFEVLAKIYYNVNSKLKTSKKNGEVTE